MRGTLPPACPLLAAILFLLLVLVPTRTRVATAGTLAPIKGNVKVGELVMSPIGVGTWAWGNRFLWGYDSARDDAELRATYDYVVSKGVTWFDTADSYGTGALAGQSEKLLGQFAQQGNTKKAKVNFCTKLAPYPFRIGEQSMLSAAAESSARLGRPLDMVQLHWPPVAWLQPGQETAYLRAFARLVADGRATQVGVSNYGPQTLRRAAQTAADAGARIASNQVQFSLLSRYPLTSGLDEACAELGVRPIGYSPLALGLLTDKYTVDNLPSGPRGLLFREFLPVMGNLLGELRSVARSRKKTVSQVALNWNLQKGFLVLVGVRSVAQAKDNLGAVGWALTPAEVEALDRAAAKVPKQLIQNSFQTS
jgi:pyridoxine 4-dehydrogenase